MNHNSDLLLDCQGITRRFGGLVALDGLDLQVREGEILGLIGPNGSGKTTMFNVVTGIYGAHGGRVEFDGNDLTNATAQQVYRSGIVRTFQRSRMCLELSVFDNIMVGNHRRLNHGLWFNLFKRGAFADQYKSNYAEARELIEIFDPPLAELLDESVETFPMIDRRRIEICRALISHPKLLLLDEPSAGMTHDETMQLMDDILTVRKRLSGLTIIIIEHEMGVIERITDHCVVLNFGRKICEGTFKKVSTDSHVQEAYLGVE